MSFVSSTGLRIADADIQTHKFDWVSLETDDLNTLLHTVASPWLVCQTASDGTIQFSYDELRALCAERVTLDKDCDARIVAVSTPSGSAVAIMTARLLLATGLKGPTDYMTVVGELQDLPEPTDSSVPYSFKNVELIDTPPATGTTIAGAFGVGSKWQTALTYGILRTSKAGKALLQWVWYHEQANAELRPLPALAQLHAETLAAGRLPQVLGGGIFGGIVAADEVVAAAVTSFFGSYPLADAATRLFVPRGFERAAMMYVEAQSIRNPPDGLNATMRERVPGIISYTRYPHETLLKLVISTPGAVKIVAPLEQVLAALEHAASAAMPGHAFAAPEKLFTRVGLRNLEQKLGRFTAFLSFDEISALGLHERAVALASKIHASSTAPHSSAGGDAGHSAAPRGDQSGGGTRAPGWTQKVLQAAEEGASPLIIQKVAAMLEDPHPDPIKILNLMLVGISDAEGVILHRSTSLTHAIAMGNIDAAIIDVKLANLKVLCENNFARYLGYYVALKYIARNMASEVSLRGLTLPKLAAALRGNKWGDAVDFINDLIITVANHQHHSGGGSARMASVPSEQVYADPAYSYMPMMASAVWECLGLDSRSDQSFRVIMEDAFHVLAGYGICTDHTYGASLVAVRRLAKSLLKEACDHYQPARAGHWPAMPRPTTWLPRDDQVGGRAEWAQFKTRLIRTTEAQQDYAMWGAQVQHQAAGHGGSQGFLAASQSLQGGQYSSVPGLGGADGRQSYTLEQRYEGAEHRSGFRSGGAVYEIATSAQSRSQPTRYDAAGCRKQHPGVCIPWVAGETAMRGLGDKLCTHGHDHRHQPGGDAHPDLATLQPAMSTFNINKQKRKAEQRNAPRQERVNPQDYRQRPKPSRSQGDNPHATGYAAVRRDNGAMDGGGRGQRPQAPAGSSRGRGRGRGAPRGGRGGQQSRRPPPKGASAGKTDAKMGGTTGDGGHAHRSALRFLRQQFATHLGVVAQPSSGEAAASEARQRARIASTGLPTSWRAGGKKKKQRGGGHRLNEALHLSMAEPPRAACLLSIKLGGAGVEGETIDLQIPVASIGEYTSTATGAAARAIHHSYPNLLCVEQGGSGQCVPSVISKALTRQGLEPAITAQQLRRQVCEWLAAECNQRRSAVEQLSFGELMTVMCDTWLQDARDFGSTVPGIGRQRAKKKHGDPTPPVAGPAMYIAGMVKANTWADEAFYCAASAIYDVAFIGIFANSDGSIRPAQRICAHGVQPRAHVLLGGEAEVHCLALLHRDGGDVLSLATYIDDPAPSPSPPATDDDMCDDEQLQLAMAISASECVAAARDKRHAHPPTTSAAVPRRACRLTARAESHGDDDYWNLKLATRLSEIAAAEANANEKAHEHELAESLRLSELSATDDAAMRQASDDADLAAAQAASLRDATQARQSKMYSDELRANTAEMSASELSSALLLALFVQIQTMPDVKEPMKIAHIILQHADVDPFHVLTSENALTAAVSDVTRAMSAAGPTATSAYLTANPAPPGTSEASSLLFGSFRAGGTKPSDDVDDILDQCDIWLTGLDEREAEAAHTYRQLCEAQCKNAYRRGTTCHDLSPTERCWPCAWRGDHGEYYLNEYLGNKAQSLPPSRVYLWLQCTHRKCVRMGSDFGIVNTMEHWRCHHPWCEAQAAQRILRWAAHQPRRPTALSTRRTHTGTEWAELQAAPRQWSPCPHGAAYLGDCEGARGHPLTAIQCRRTECEQAALSRAVSTLHAWGMTPRPTPDTPAMEGAEMRHMSSYPTTPAGPTDHRGATPMQPAVGKHDITDTCDPTGAGTTPHARTARRDTALSMAVALLRADGMTPCHTSSFADPICVTCEPSDDGRTPTPRTWQEALDTAARNSEYKLERDLLATINAIKRPALRAEFASWTAGSNADKRGRRTPPAPSAAIQRPQRERRRPARSTTDPPTTSAPLSLAGPHNADDPQHHAHGPPRQPAKRRCAAPPQPVRPDCISERGRWASRALRDGELAFVNGDNRAEWSVVHKPGNPKKPLLLRGPSALLAQLRHENDDTPAGTGLYTAAPLRGKGHCKGALSCPSEGDVAAWYAGQVLAGPFKTPTTIAAKSEGFAEAASGKRHLAFIKQAGQWYLVDGQGCGPPYASSINDARRPGGNNCRLEDNGLVRATRAIPGVDLLHAGSLEELARSELLLDYKQSYWLVHDTDKGSYHTKHVGSPVRCSADLAAAHEPAPGEAPPDMHYEACDTTSGAPADPGPSSHCEAPTDEPSDTAAPAQPAEPTMADAMRALEATVASTYAGSPALAQGVRALADEHSWSSLSTSGIARRIEHDLGLTSGAMNPFLDTIDEAMHATITAILTERQAASSSRGLIPSVGHLAQGPALAYPSPTPQAALAPQRPAAAADTAQHRTLERPPSTSKQATCQVVDLTTSPGTLPGDAAQPTAQRPDATIPRGPHFTGWRCGAAHPDNTTSAIQTAQQACINDWSRRRPVDKRRTRMDIDPDTTSHIINAAQALGMQSPHGADAYMSTTTRSLYAALLYHPSAAAQGFINPWSGAKACADEMGVQLRTLQRRLRTLRRVLSTPTAPDEAGPSAVHSATPDSPHEPSAASDTAGPDATAQDSGWRAGCRDDATGATPQEPSPTASTKPAPPDSPRTAASEKALRASRALRDSELAFVNGDNRTEWSTAAVLSGPRPDPDQAHALRIRAILEEDRHSRALRIRAFLERRHNRAMPQSPMTGSAWRAGSQTTAPELGDDSHQHDDSGTICQQCGEWCAPGLQTRQPGGPRCHTCDAPTSRQRLMCQQCGRLTLDGFCDACHIATQYSNAGLEPTGSTGPRHEADPRVHGQRKKILHLFSGTHGEFKKAGLLAGLEVTEIDIAIDGTDLGDPATQRRLEAEVLAGEFEAILIGTPCASFSVALAADGHTGTILRSWAHPDGLPDLQGANADKLRYHNRLVDFTARIAALQVRTHGELIIENPPSRANPESKAYWPARSHMPPLWATSAMTSLFAAAKRAGWPLHIREAPQCAFGRNPAGLLFQKWSAFAMTPGAAARLAGFDKLQCAHQRDEHDATTGRGPDGSANSTRAAAYPRRLCNSLLYGLTGVAVGAHEDQLHVRPEQAKPRCEAEKHTAAYMPRAAACPECGGDVHICQHCDFWFCAGRDYGGASCQTNDADAVADTETLLSEADADWLLRAKRCREQDAPAPTAAPTPTTAPTISVVRLADLNLGQLDGDGRRVRPPAGVVDITGGSAFANPFRTSHAGDSHDAARIAFTDYLTTGDPIDVVHSRHQLQTPPRDAVRHSVLITALQVLHTRALSGERIVLACAGAPEQSHGGALINWLREHDYINRNRTFSDAALGEPRHPSPTPAPDAVAENRAKVLKRADRWVECEHGAVQVRGTAPRPPGFPMHATCTKPDCVQLTEQWWLALPAPPPTTGPTPTAPSTGRTINATGASLQEQAIAVLVPVCRRSPTAATEDGTTEWMALLPRADPTNPAASVYGLVLEAGPRQKRRETAVQSAAACAPLGAAADGCFLAGEATLLDLAFSTAEVAMAHADDEDQAYSRDVTVDVVVAPVHSEAADGLSAAAQGEWHTVTTLAARAADDANCNLRYEAGVLAIAQADACTRPSAADDSRAATGAAPERAANSTTAAVVAADVTLRQRAAVADAAAAELRSILLHSDSDAPDSYTTMARDFAGRIERAGSGTVPEALWHVTLPRGPDDILQRPFLHKAQVIPTPVRPLPPYDPPHLNGWWPHDIEDVIMPQPLARIRTWLSDVQRWHKAGGPARSRPKTLAFGIDAIWPAARGRQWDFSGGAGHVREVARAQSLAERQARTCIDLTKTAHILHDCEDKELCDFVVHGVRFHANLAHDVAILLCPNLLSMYEGGGVAKAAEQAADMIKHGFITTFNDIPCCPFRIVPRGVVAKAGTTELRGVMDQGAPRKPTYTEDTDVLVTSLNDVCRAGGWAHEYKDDIESAAHNGAILQAMADACGEAVLELSADFSKFFHRLYYHILDLFQGGALIPDQVTGLLRIAIEGAMSMGSTPSSQIAQRLGCALIQALYKHMDIAEAEAEANELAQHPEGGPDFPPALTDIRRARAALPHDSYGGMSRCYDCVQYSDDLRIATFGPRRMARLLRAFHDVIGPGGANIPLSRSSKQQLGVAVKWLGCFTAAGLGLMWVSPDKALRATAALRQAMAGDMPVGDYRRMLGFLVSIKFMMGGDDTLLHHIFNPLRAGGELERGPATLVAPSAPMLRTLTRWQNLIATVPGAPAIGALTPTSMRFGERRHLIFSDAALEENGGEPIGGLGGFLYGKYWALSTTEIAGLEHLAIPHLEALAAGASVLTFSAWLQGASRVCLETDALATATALTARARSPAMQTILDALLAQPEYSAIAKKLTVRHVYGARNWAADAASRFYFDTLERTCAALGIAAERIPLSPAATEFITTAVKNLLEVRERGDPAPHPAAADSGGWRAGGAHHPLDPRPAAAKAARGEAGALARRIMRLLTYFRHPPLGPWCPTRVNCPSITRRIDEVCYHMRRATTEHSTANDIEAVYGTSITSIRLKMSELLRNWPPTGNAARLDTLETYVRIFHPPRLVQIRRTRAGGAPTTPPHVAARQDRPAWRAGSSAHGTGAGDSAEEQPSPPGRTAAEASPRAPPPPCKRKLTGKDEALDARHSADAQAADDAGSSPVARETAGQREQTAATSRHRSVEPSLASEGAGTTHIPAATPSAADSSSGRTCLPSGQADPAADPASGGRAAGKRPFQYDDWEQPESSSDEASPRRPSPSHAPAQAPHDRATERRRAFDAWRCGARNRHRRNHRHQRGATASDGEEGPTPHVLTFDMASEHHHRSIPLVRHTNKLTLVASPTATEADDEAFLQMLLNPNEDFYKANAGMGDHAVQRVSPALAKELHALFTRQADGLAPTEPAAALEATTPSPRKRDGHLRYGWRCGAQAGQHHQGIPGRTVAPSVCITIFGAAQAEPRLAALWPNRPVRDTPGADDRRHGPPASAPQPPKGGTTAKRACRHRPRARHPYHRPPAPQTHRGLSHAPLPQAPVHVQRTRGPQGQRQRRQRPDTTGIAGTASSAGGAESQQPPLADTPPAHLASPPPPPGNPASWTAREVHRLRFPRGSDASLSTQAARSDELQGLAALIRSMRRRGVVSACPDAWATRALRDITADCIASHVGMGAPTGWRCGARATASRSPSPPLARLAAQAPPTPSRARPPANAARTPPSRSRVSQGPPQRRRAGANVNDGSARPPVLPAHANRDGVQAVGVAMHAARALMLDETVARLRADTSDGAIGGSEEMLEWMVQSALEGDAEAVARNTRLQQNSNWKAWSRFCASAAISPWRPALTQENAEREGVIWGAAFFHIYSHMKPRKGNYIKHGPRAGHLCPPKPQSALAVLRGARKEHLDRGIQVPALNLATRRCKEVLRRYAEHIGPENIVPNRKAPMSHELIVAILSTSDGEPLLKDGKPWNWSTAYGRSCRALFHTLAQTGFRKAEISVATGAKWGPMHLSFANLTWIVQGVHCAHLNVAALFALREGDYAVIRPPPSKADPFGLRWGNNPIYMPFCPDARINAARALSQWELCAMVPPDQRRQTPLFCDSEGAGVPLREKTITEHFYRLVRWCVQDDDKAKMYSIHSFRSYLCSALMASGRSDAEIQLALRWASDDALRIYKVANVETYASWLIEAEQQRLTGVRAISLPRPAPEHDHLDRAQGILAAGPQLAQLADCWSAGEDHMDTLAVDYEL